MTILFITEGLRRTAPLDLLHLRYVPVKSHIEEDLLPSIFEGSNDLISEIPSMRVEEFLHWYEKIFPLTNNWSDRLWNKPSCDLSEFPARLVLNTYSCIETSKHSIFKVRNAQDLRKILFCIRDEGTVLIRTSLLLYDLLSMKSYQSTSAVTVVYRFDIDDSLIEDYINSCEAFEGDGSFLLNGRALYLIQSLYGQPLTSMGFPIMDFHRFIREAGITLRSLSVR